MAEKREKKLKTQKRFTEYYKQKQPKYLRKKKRVTYGL